MLWHIAFLMIFVRVNAFDSGFIAQIDTFLNQSKVTANDSQTVSFNAYITYSVSNIALSNLEIDLQCWVENTKVGNIVNWTDLVLQPAVNVNKSTFFFVNIVTRRLGRSNVICDVILKANNTMIYESKIAQLIVIRAQSVNDLIFRIVVSVFIAIIAFLTGCNIDKSVIIEYIRHPLSPCIGFIPQLLLMPLIATGLGKLTYIDNEFGLGLLIIGSSFGGSVSNLWSLLYGNDAKLSMVMAFVSSFLSIGIMPLWLFLLSRIFIDYTVVEISYGCVALNILLVIIPVAFGIVFRGYFRETALIFLKKVKLVGLIFVIVIFTYGTYVNIYFYKVLTDYGYLIPIAIILPWLGFFFGSVLAILTRRDKNEVLTIGLESGFQNSAMAILIAKFSTPLPEGDLASVMCFIVIFFTPITLLIGNAIVMLINRFGVKGKKEHEKIDEKKKHKIKSENKEVKEALKENEDVEQNAGIEVQNEALLETIT